MSEANPTSTLCEECLGMSFDDAAGDAYGAPASKTPWKRTDTYPDLPILSASADACCTFCKYLCFLIRETLPLRLANALIVATDKRITVELASPAYVRRSDVTVHASDLARELGHHETDGLYWLELVLRSPAWPAMWRAKAMVYQHEGYESVSRSLGISLRIPASEVLDQACIGRLRGWLQTCTNEHPRCQVSGARRLPTRLIDVGTTTTSIPKLIASSSLATSAPYIALSYCWGPPSATAPQLTTTTATLADRQAGIPTSTLPATHRDFVVLARRLALRYVWIDALCIIQDDAVDWENEAASMFAVYRHAHLTVVAAAGDSCNSGFLSRSATASGPRVMVPFRSKKQRGRVSGSYLLSHLPERRTWDANNPAHLHGCAWASRAWTFQEDIMSTRVLYFSNVTSFFRCQTERRLEHGTAAVHTNVCGWHDMLSAPSASVLPSSVAGGEDDTASDPKSGLYKLWRALVNEYGRRSLTVANDKFPAMSGLARSFASAVGGDSEYVAGIWRGDLVRGMLWATAHDVSSPPAWRAPSWSWAAWQGELGWGEVYSQAVLSRCTIHEVEVVPSGTDPFGKLKGGHITLSASLCPVILRPADRADQDDGDSFAADVMMDNDNACGLIVAARASMDAITSSGLKMDGTWKPIDMRPVASLAGISALFLALTCVYLGEDEETGELQYSAPSFPAGILVTKVTGQLGGAGMSVYRRVGVFITETSEQANLWVGHPYIQLKII
ncbi:heterokaryon incompatibility protein-domain-containing protein [Lasiosphaeris hirsuta]|uniref:Heterokaryon incompatibility protein-domain-containing protein n=1 Tax=Lasiosphaeris hirsuta TaxID=260670 RepID=A0AA40B8G8_9PEZI|nr:heterokaryon incompatibility protein-domain-containing protein [Lasiosphaeris hirsuta]